MSRGFTDWDGVRYKDSLGGALNMLEDPGKSENGGSGGECSYHVIALFDSF